MQLPLFRRRRNWKAFVLFGIPICVAVALLGRVALLGMLVGFGTVQSFLVGDWRFLHASDSIVVVAGVGGFLGLLGLVVAWFGLVVPSIVQRARTPVMTLIALGIAAAGANATWLVPRLVETRTLWNEEGLFAVLILLCTLIGVVFLIEIARLERPPAEPA